MVRSVFPTEEEQKVVYRQLFDRMAGRPVYIRTLDIGGDKILPYSGISQESNPELGLRSIRFSLKHRDIFDQQIRAILRAGADSHHLGILFPMISSIDEFQTARQMVHDAMAELGRQNLDHHSRPSIGAMVELPAIIDILDELAPLADFFSIGTNDFIQYMLAVDRTNESVADYYQPYHPGILRSLARIVKSAQKHGKPISVCGEVAHETKFIPFLIGIGVRRLSLDPQFLPAVQNAIADVTVEAAENYARQLLSCSTIDATAHVLSSWQIS
jgi:phosphotransferase system enzyme I (PtsP)